MQREITNHPALASYIKTLGKGDYRKALILLAVIDYLDGSATQAELENNTGINRGVIRNHVDHLSQLGVQIKTAGKGTGVGDTTYQLTSWGNLIKPEAVRSMLKEILGENNDV